MKLYRISGNADFQKTYWVGTKSDAAKVRKELIADAFKRAELLTEEVDVPTNKELIADGFRRAELLTEEVDVPTNKEGLIAFLNKLEA